LHLSAFGRDPKQKNTSGKQLNASNFSNGKDRVCRNPNRTLGALLISVQSDLFKICISLSELALNVGIKVKILRNLTLKKGQHQ